MDVLPLHSNTFNFLQVPLHIHVWVDDGGSHRCCNASQGKKSGDIGENLWRKKAALPRFIHL